jgi:hypothetical protein
MLQEQEAMYRESGWVKCAGIGFDWPSFDRRIFIGRGDQECGSYPRGDAPMGKGSGTPVWCKAGFLVSWFNIYIIHIIRLNFMVESKRNQVEALPHHELRNVLFGL